MWPIGHASGAYLLLELWHRRYGERPGEGTVWVLGLGAMLPDLVDKPLSWYLHLLPAGRSLSHSLLFVVPLCLLVGFVARRQRAPAWGGAFAIGALSHLLLDAGPALWTDPSRLGWLLYPALPVESYPGGPPTILGLLLGSMADPYFYFEFVLFALAFAVWRRRGYPGLRVLRSQVREHRA